MLAVLAMVGMVGACSSKSGSSQGPATVPETLSSGLGSKVLPSLEGFTVSTGPQTSGPESIDKIANGDAAVSQRLRSNGFVAAYVRTFDQGSARHVAVVVTQFRTAKGAAGYSVAALRTGTAGDPNAPRFAVAGVAGATGIDIGTRETPGQYVRLITYAKDTYVAEVLAVGQDASAPSQSVVVSVATKEAPLI